MTPKEKSSIKWFFDKIKGARGTSGDRKRANVSFYTEQPGDPFIGGMFFYVYDAKHKETLPVWDAFPLVIPIEIYPDGFLGLNLHYLSPPLRAQLLKKLSSLVTKTNSRTYMKLSYKILSVVSKSELFSPCIKRYLAGHIRSEIVKVHPDEWMTAASLPLQKFQNMSSTQVWKGV